MKVLVTGGTGFIGSFVVEELLRSHHEVMVVANGRQFPPYLNNVIDRIGFYQCDFGDSDALNSVLPGCDAVIHLAWSSIPKPTLGATGYEFTSNIISGINLIEKCIEHKISKFVFISSGGTVYGIPTRIPIPESHELNPISTYGLGKLTMEKLLHLYHYSHGMKYSILRVSNAYGERQNILKAQGVIAVWIKKILCGEPVEVWGDGQVVRDYVYVKDVAYAIVRALEDKAGRSVYNIGGGEGYSLNEILFKIEEVMNVRFDIMYKESRKFDVPVNILDISKARKDLGFEPKTALHEGIAIIRDSLSEELSVAPVRKDMLKITAL